MKKAIAIMNEIPNSTQIYHSTKSNTVVTWRIARMFGDVGSVMYNPMYQQLAGLNMRGYINRVIYV